MAGWGENLWGSSPWGDGENWDGYSNSPRYPLILSENLFSLSPIEVTDTATEYNIQNITDLRPYTFHQFASAGTKYFTIDCVSPRAANGIAFLGHNFFTATATISVWSSQDGINWTERVAGFTVTTDLAFLKSFPPGVARYWRVKIVTASVAARLAVCVLGVRLEFPRYLTGNFDPFPEKINAVSGRSKAGYLVGITRKNISVEIDAAWKGLTTTWIENYFRPVWDDHLSLCLPCFWSWDPASHPTEIYFVGTPPDFQLSMPFDPFRRSLKLIFQGIKE